MGDNRIIKYKTIDKTANYFKYLLWFSILFTIN
jgi:hypothetical protein